MEEVQIKPCTHSRQVFSLIQIFDFGLVIYIFLLRYLNYYKCIAFNFRLNLWGISLSVSVNTCLVISHKTAYDFANFIQQPAPPGRGPIT